MTFSLLDHLKAKSLWGQYMEIKIRPSIRVLGVLLSLACFFVDYIIISDAVISNINPLEKTSAFHLFFFITGSIFFIPIVFISSILGRVPFFLSRRIPKFFEDSVLHAEKNFTEFSWESGISAFIFLCFVFASYWFA